MPQIEVSFDIDSDGVVSVSATDLGTGRKQEIRVSASSGLSESEVKRLLGEAEKHAAADKSRAEFAELRNQGNGLVYSTRRTLAEFGDQLDADARKALEAALERTDAALAGSDTETLRVAVDELTTLSYKMTEKMYETLGGQSSE